MADKKQKQEIDYRFLARIVIECATPLAVHSGEKNFQTDAVVMRDANDLPYIPGSSIAGVIRHALTNAGKEYVNDLFGYPNAPKMSDGMGSRIIFTEARIMNSTKQVIDGLQPNAMDDELLKHYVNLPIRQHVRINHKGTADKDKKGKYDEQIVYAGTRFCFEVEFLGVESEEDKFKNILDILYNSTFRLGSGSRKGFGKIEVTEILYRALPLTDKSYLNKSSNLEECKNWYSAPYKRSNMDAEHDIVTYNLRPANFFLFGSGFGDDDADITPVKEQRVTWKDNLGVLGKNEYLIPASSVKGALAHRVAYHYNRLTDYFVDDSKTEADILAHSGANNDAVKLLFGNEGDTNGNNKQRGNVILSDIYVDTAHSKTLQHVAIDRFTGGAIAGALFSEKSAYWRSADSSLYPLTLEIFIDKKRIKESIPQSVEYKKVIASFNAAMKDLCEGNLPLGGGTSRGHGCFNGKWIEIKP